MSEQTETQQLMQQMQQMMQMMMQQNQQMQNKIDSLEQQGKVESKSIEMEEKTKQPVIQEEARRAAWNTDYTFADFQRELRSVGCFFSSVEKEKEFILPRLLKVVRLINYEGSKVVILKPSKESDGPKLIPYLKFCSTYSTKNSFYIVQIITGDSVVNEKRNYFHYMDFVDSLTYYHFDWIPYHPWEQDPTWGTDNFNLFSGYKAKAVPLGQIQTGKFKLILDHIFDVWADKNAQVFVYILSWLSHFIRNPRKWLPMITLIGAEGTGKSSIIEFLFDYVFGLKTCEQVATLDTVLHGFNALLDQKGFIYIAELAGTHTSEASMHKKMDEFKVLVTNPRYQVTYKGVDTMSRTNYLHWIGSSQKDDCLRLGGTNRRHIALMTNDCHVGDKVYFDNLFATFNQETANHFYSWLYHLPDISEVTKLVLIDPYKLIKTQLMATMTKMSLTDAALFVAELNGEEYHIPMEQATLNNCKLQETIIDHKDYPGQLLIQKVALFSCYEVWCKSNGIKNQAAKWFFQEINKALKYLKPHGQTSSFYIIPNTWIKIVVPEGKSQIISMLSF